MKRSNKPLVYSCSGCSDVAQLANDLALRMDQSGEAEMSCISGVGGRVPALVRLARSGRKLIAIDGCALHCARSCLEQIHLEPDLHLRLYEEGYKKHPHQLYDEETLQQASSKLLQQVINLQEESC